MSWNATPAAIRDAAVAAVLAGRAVQDVAVDMGITARTIRRWCGGRRGVYLKPCRVPANGIKRTCLTCSAAFVAETKFLRMCPDCRTASWGIAA